MEKESLIDRLFERFILGIKPVKIIVCNDGHTQEEKDESYRWFNDYTPTAKRIYLGRHGGGKPCSASVLEDCERYDARQKHFLGRLYNRVTGHPLGISQ